MLPQKQKPLRLLSNISKGIESIVLKASGFSLDMEDPIHVIIRGCKNIAYYSPNLICIRLSSGCINVCGKSLFCSSFSIAVIGIEGKIKSVFFSELPPKMRCVK